MLLLALWAGFLACGSSPQSKGLNELLRAPPIAPRTSIRSENNIWVSFACVADAEIISGHIL
jgi:hypothetical protein